MYEEDTPQYDGMDVDDYVKLDRLVSHLYRSTQPLITRVSQITRGIEIFTKERKEYDIRAEELGIDLESDELLEYSHYDLGTMLDHREWDNRLNRIE